MQTFQNNPAWQLAASVTPTQYGHYLLVSSYVPTARRPEHQVKLSATLTTDELRTLRDILDQALMEANHG